MAIVLEDDLEGGKADETVKFALDGIQYEIDLSEKNAQKLRDAVASKMTPGQIVAGQRLAAAWVPKRVAVELVPVPVPGW